MYTETEYKENNFTCSESFLELISYFICKRMEQNGLNTYSINLMSIYRTYDNNRSGHVRGFVDLMLDAYMVSNTDKQDYIQVINQTKTDVSDLGNEISVAQLTNIESEKNPPDLRFKYNFPIKTSSINNLLDLIIKLVNEEKLSNDGSGLFISFIGFENIDVMADVFL